MIKVTHLDGEPFLLNAEQIRYVEARPDTFITMSPGERVVVRESLDEVLRLCVEYQRSKQLPPTALSTARAHGGGERRHGALSETT